MPNLSQILPANDLGFIRIVASLWGVELTSADPVAASMELAEALCDAELVEEVVSTLPKDGRTALEALAESGGRIAWGMFARRFGEVREMGAGKRDREQPHLHPKSGAEILWYRALLARAFFDTEQGAQEFAFIPDDLLMALEFAGVVVVEEQKSLGRAGYDSVGKGPDTPALPTHPTTGGLRLADGTREKNLSTGGAGGHEKEQGINLNITARVEKTIDKKDSQKNAARPSAPGAGENPLANKSEDPLGRPASPAEKAYPILSSDRLLDDACTLLAALRVGIQPVETGVPVTVVKEFLSAAKIILDGEVQPEPVKSFLEAPRAKALEMLAGAWQDSESFNELRQIPGLACEGEWKNEPLVTREFLLNLLNTVPEKQWWSLPAFVRDVKARYPDFQRPAGDYDSWFIKRESDGVFLRGFANWDNVDGALMRYFISGPLFWLGMLDLAAPEEGAAPAAFRAISDESQASKAENGRLSVLSNGRISVPRLTPRAARYQIARFCEWDQEKDDQYPYRVTPASLTHAKEQGLKPEHLIGLLRKHAAAPLPPPFVRALQRWEANGIEARVENVVVLKVSRPEVLNELRASKAGRFLGEVLGPVTVVVKSGAQSKVLAALAEMGLLAESQTDSITDSRKVPLAGIKTD